MIERDGRLDVFREQRDQRLRQRIAKDEFRPNDQDLATAPQNKTKISPHRSQEHIFKRKDAGGSRSRSRSRRARTFGVRPLNRPPMPSLRTSSRKTTRPWTRVSKFAFWMRVLMTSSGAATVMLATAPAIEATKFWPHVALW